LGSAAGVGAEKTVEKEMLRRARRDMEGDIFLGCLVGINEASKRVFGIEVEMIGRRRMSEA